MRRRKYSDDFRSGYRRSYSREISPLEQIARTALELHKLLGVDNLDLRKHYDRSNEVRHRPVDRRSDFSRQGDDEDLLDDVEEVRYHSLCVSDIPHRLCDSDIREEIFRYCKYCGDFNVKISSYNGERVAYINFRSSRQATKAIECLKNFKLDSKMVRIEPVIHNYNNGRSPRNVRQKSPVYSYNYDTYQTNRRCNDSYSPIRYSRHRSRSPSRLSIKLPKSNYNAKDVISIPTRTLFIGNLPFDITEKGLKDVFSKFGEVTDIDIKKPVTNRQASSYAFIKFENLDIANQAKSEMSGYTIGKCQIKIGFGKVNPTSCVWVGGLGPWILYDTFEKEMTRFGVVKQIDWPHSKNYAYVLYESVDVAITAVNRLRGTHFCDESKPIKVDFADISVMKPISLLPKKEPKNNNRDILKKSIKDSITCIAKSSPKSEGSSMTDELSVHSAKSITQLITCLVDVWTGMIVLKNNNFGCRLYILKGEKSIINDFMFSKNVNDESKSHVENLTITQRMKLDCQKLSEMSQRIECAGENGFCLLLASSYIIDTKLAGDAIKTNQPQRPLKNLITYLRTKDSAGVISLKSHNQSAPSTGVLHAFPPCDFSFNILLQKAPNLTKDFLKDDFLVVLLIRNSV